MENKDVQLIKRLVERLEHLSADSSYAHRASGLRGSLLRYLDRLEGGEYPGHEEQARLEQVVEDGYEILELAAKEMGGSK